MLQRLIRLIIKELLAILGSRQGRSMLIMPVILQTLLFPFAATMEVKNATLLIFNQDSGQASQELIQRLAQTASFPHLIMAHSDHELTQAIDGQTALLAIRIAPDFSRQRKAQQSAGVQIVIDGRRSNSGQIAAGYVTAIIQTYLAEQTGAPNGAPGAALTSSPEVRNLYNPNLEFRWHLLPSLVVIITTIGCLMVTALSVAREREEGTFEQLLVSPLTPAYIMAGKAIPGILIAMVQGTFIALVAHFGYGVPFTGSIAMLFAGMFCYGLALAGVGLFISSISNTQQQAFLGVFAFMVPATMLSGYVAPIENMPLLLQWLAQINPMSYCVPVIKGVFLKNYQWADCWPRLWPMLGIALFTLTVALRMFRRHIA
jgi:ABC-2 type transport system permease protein